MSSKTKIEWCDATINPIVGCSQISDGCKRCYAKTLTNRLNGMKIKKYRRAFETIVYDPKVLEKARKDIKKSQFIFLNSMGDMFHIDVKKEWVVDIFKFVNEFPDKTFLILTKRPKNIPRFAKGLGVPNNLWIGVSVESQKYIDRIDILNEYWPGHKFISFEPLIGEIDLKKYAIESFNGNYYFEWVIVGGETGAGARYMCEGWVSNIKVMADAAKIPFFFKGIGAWIKHSKKSEDYFKFKKEIYFNRPIINEVKA